MNSPKSTILFLFILLLYNYCYSQRFPRSIIDTTDKIYYSGQKVLHFKSKLNCNGRGFYKDVELPMAIFDSIADFSNAIFKSIANFSEAKFNSEALFTSSQFDSAAYFSTTKFNSNTYYRRAKFNFIAEFWHSEFDSISDFSLAQFNTTARFYNAVFNSTANFRDTKFNSIADFTGVQFISGARFSAAQFDSTAQFYDADFMSTAYFSETKFNSTADFRKTKFILETRFFSAKFNSNARFSSVQFDSIVYFSSAVFDSTVYFWNTKFNSIAYFWGTEFSSTAYFRDAKFNSIADFSDAEFKSIANFKNVNFDSSAIFKNVVFNSEIIFDSTLLPKNLSFYNVQDIQKEIDLTGAIINPQYNICYINLTYANVDKFRFRYNRFKLYFDDETESELKSNVYEELLRKTEKEGFINSYEKLDREYREFKYLEGKKYEKKRTWGKIINWIDKTWWGYGYDKELILRNTLLLFIIFLIINLVFLRQMLFKVYNVEHFSSLRQEIQGFILFNIPKLFLITILYTSLIFFGLKFNFDYLKIRENLYSWRIVFLIYFFLQYIIGLVCLAYLANFIITT